MWFRLMLRMNSTVFYIPKNDIIKIMSEQLNEKNRKKWTAVFVGTIAAIGLVCMTVMNMHFDALARYPYLDRRSRALIKQYLKDDEIEYIIEYSIAPNMFVAYLQEKGFNIYHAREYKALSAFAWDKPAAQIVEMVETTRPYIPVEQLIEYLKSYSYEDIRTFLETRDPYDPDGVLLAGAIEENAYLGEHDTVARYRPVNLTEIDPAAAESRPGVQLRATVSEPLKSMCDAMKAELSSERACAGLKVSEGYISYEEQEARYRKALEQYGDDARKYEPLPGHSENQLGLALRFSISGLSEADFEKSIQAQWLQDSAWKYGFVQSRSAEDEQLTGMTAVEEHYRYIGVEYAQKLHEEKSTFAADAIARKREMNQE